MCELNQLFLMNKCCFFVFALPFKVSDSIKESNSYMWEFRSLQMSLLLCSFVAVGGGAFFLATAVFIEKDRDLAENYVPSGEWHHWWHHRLLLLFFAILVISGYFWELLFVLLCLYSFSYAYFYWFFLCIFQVYVLNCEIYTINNARLGRSFKMINIKNNNDSSYLGFFYQWGFCITISLRYYYNY